MSILADSQIKELCTPPTFVSTLRESVHYTRMTPAEIDAFNLKFAGSVERPTNETMLKFWMQTRELTPIERESWRPMIHPFVGHQVRHINREFTDDDGFFMANDDKVWAKTNTVNDEGERRTIDERIISYGLSSYGYDVTLADEYKMFTNINGGVIDPLDFDEKCLHDHKGKYCIIPPNSYILGRTNEYFCIPKDIMVLCVGKSTYARVGAIVNVTPIEAGFEGNVVIEISNSTSLPLKVYTNQGICQFMFFRGQVPCNVSYADRGGKYQGQVGITTAKV